MFTPSQMRTASFGAFGASLLTLGLGLFGGPGAGDLEYRLDVKPTVMTVAYKAYGNEDAADGKYWLARVVMENDGESALEDVAVSYRIPDYLDWTTPQTIEEVLPGQTRVVPIYPKLPTRVTSLRSRTPSSLEIKFAWNDGQEDHEKIEVRQFEFRGVNEIEYTSLAADEMLTWHDMYDNAEITAAYVTDEDQVVRQYLGEISETMGGMPICSTGEELAKTMESIYVYQVGTGMTYSGNKGVPERLGDATSTVQSVRLPRDVIYQNSGLCIELAMLWAALGQGSSAKAYLALVPGHCFPVLEANDGTIIAIESTGIGGSNLGGTMKFADAVEAGNKQFNQLMRGEIPGVLIDVVLHQGRGVRPPEFEAVNLADLARLLDERTAKALAQGGQGQQQQDTQRQQDVQRQDDTQRRDDPQRRDDGNVGSNWQWYQVPGLNATVPYPQGYTADTQTVQQLQQHIPAIQFMASDPRGEASIEIYAAANMTARQLMNDSQNLAKQMGASVSYEKAESIVIGGQQAALYPYTFNIQGQSMSGGFYIYETSAGLFGFAVGGTGSSWRNLGGQIAQAVRFGN